MVGSRDVLIHNYFDVDKDIVWNVVDKGLLLPKEQMEKLLDNK